MTRLILTAPLKAFRTPIYLKLFPLLATARLYTCTRLEMVMHSFVHDQSWTQTHRPCQPCEGWVSWMAVYASCPSGCRVCLPRPLQWAKMWRCLEVTELNLWLGMWQVKGAAKYAYVSIKEELLHFGDVLVGTQSRRDFPLRNPGPVAAEWSIELMADEHSPRSCFSFSQSK